MGTDYNNIHVTKINEAWIHVAAEMGVLMELRDHFTFDVPKMHFDPRVRAKQWDGKIRLLHAKTSLLYAGLVPHIEEFAKDRGYNVTYDKRNPANLTTEFSLAEAKTFVESLDIRGAKGEKITVRDDQIKEFAKAIRDKRRTIIFPTGGGKSLIAYLIVSWLWHKQEGKKGLIIVPTTTLVEQLYEDFNDYSGKAYLYTADTFRLYEGRDPNTKAHIVISTWQTAVAQSKEWLEQFDYVITDEAHGAKAKSIIYILSNMINAKYRIGMTGTLDDYKVNKWIIEGLHGLAIQEVFTKDLIDQKVLSNLKIKGIVLVHPQTVAKGLKDIARLNGHKSVQYDQEIKFLVGSQARNNFIVNLGLSMKENTLILFHLKEKQGRILEEMFKEKLEPWRTLYYVDGDIDTDLRNKYRGEIEKDENGVVLASYGTFATGINIKNLHNIIFATAFKSRIRMRQAIGRGLRLFGDDKTLKIYDITDDLRINDKQGNPGTPNHTLSHFLERVDIYDGEQFPYKIYNVDLKGSHL